MMLGGMGSIPGAILGGLLLGVVEAQSLWYLGAEYRDLSAYFLLFLFLVFRPGRPHGPARRGARTGGDAAGMSDGKRLSHRDPL